MTLNSLSHLHKRGPYGNLKDIHVSDFIGLPLFNLHTSLLLCGEDQGIDTHSHVVNNTFIRTHQESRSPKLAANKVIFNRSVGFVCEDTECNTVLTCDTVDMCCPAYYLHVVSQVLESGCPNYKGRRVPLASSFNLDFLRSEIHDYHDKRLLDYLTFGFPLGLANNVTIENNADTNHSSALQYPEAVEDYISTELSLGALLGPFDHPPHPCFTWSPLMTRPKGSGRRVILDLSFGDHSVNKATERTQYDHTPFHLKLPSLDTLVDTLNILGDNARLFKVDISRAFRNVRIDPADAIHLGIKWENKYYIDQSLAFGAVHGTAIFETITDFVRFLMAKAGFQIHNYIDDLYACCHVDEADRAFHALLNILQNLGLPVNPSKIFHHVRSYPSWAL